MLNINKNLILSEDQENKIIADLDRINSKTAFHLDILDVKIFLEKIRRVKISGCRDFSISLNSVAGNVDGGKQYTRAIIRKTDKEVTISIDPIMVAMPARIINRIDTCLFGIHSRDSQLIFENWLKQEIEK